MSQLLRQDLKLIADLIEPKSRVLDIGCGNGELLAYLASEKQVDGRGIEISIDGVRKSVSQGLSVIQGDADTDLKFYPDKSFDYAILSQTIQATENPKLVLQELSRISKRLIVSIPNFGYWKNRCYLMFTGRMPVTKHLPYEWYETPNIHFCTVRDFMVLAADLNLRIIKKYALKPGKNATEMTKANQTLSNLLSEQAIFLMSA